MKSFTALIINVLVFTLIYRASAMACEWVHRDTFMAGALTAIVASLLANGVASLYQRRADRIADERANMSVFE